MSDEIRQKAERRLEQALESAGARDPRDHYRSLMKTLKEESADAFQEARRHYEETLLPAVAEGGVDPLAAWREFGLHLAELTAPGRTVAVDRTGAARPYENGGGPGEPGTSVQAEESADELLLHLPEEGRRRALLVSLPPDPSDAQKATYRLLVAGRQTV